ncbi:MAG: hypothetical protein KA170_00755 [Candidatus Promineofilum sp.]|nr:hypothetical protein [Promineifilum sp.]
MSTKRMMRWGVVLFLLVALPMMTAVMAQGQEPVGKQLPVVTEPGESQAPEANINESEPNNNTGAADVMSINDVMSGAINPSGDDDFFKFFVPSQKYNPGTGIEILIDVDALSINSPLDSTVCLYDSGGNQIGCDDDTDGLDPMYYRNLYTGWYYVRVQDFGDNGGGSDYRYNLIVSSPLLISASAANLGTVSVAGITFKSEDILAHSHVGNNAEKWVMFFDGSDLGMKTLTNVGAWGGNSDLVLGVGANINLRHYQTNNLITASPFDIVKFVVGDTGTDQGYGASSWGGFYLLLVGKNQQLTTSTEKLDALDGWQYGYNDSCSGHPVSTTGKAIVTTTGGANLTVADEDVMCKYAHNGYGPWTMYLDGSTVSGLAAEDVFAMAYDDTHEKLYLTILGTGNIAGNAVSQKDIFALSYPSRAWGGFVWRGTQHGWNYNIDAFEYSGYGGW